MGLSCVEVSITFIVTLVCDTAYMFSFIFIFEVQLTWVYLPKQSNHKSFLHEHCLTSILVY